MKGYVEEPDPQDDEDPEYKLEMFETFRAMGWSPDDLADVRYRQEYAQWLKGVESENLQ